MGDVTQAGLDILFRGADIRFYEGFKRIQQQSIKSGVTGILPMDTLEMDFPWTARLPVPRRWTGERHINSPSTHFKRVLAEPFELTFGIKEELIKFDRLGVFNQNIVELTESMAKLVDIETYQLMGKNNSTGYDAKAWFATDHPTNGGDAAIDLPAGVATTQSNLNLNTALTYDNFVTVYTNAVGYLGEDGQPLGVVPTKLVTGPALMSIGKQICTSDMIANAVTGLAGSNIVQAQDNMMKGICEYEMIPELAAYPLSWWLFCTSKPIKPVMWGQLEAPRFDYLVSPQNPNVFMKREHIYGARQWGQISETIWPLATYATGGASFGT